ncbi:MAG: NACHT domain-containing protein, partial [Methylobacter sp.]
YNAEQMAQAVSAYARYLSDECGFILLDGLPADSEVGSRPMRLENLFVPLHLDIADQEKIRQPVGSVLEQHPKLALLAAPGGGKSTLIKRLAVAYADPDRRGQAADDLPQRDWLPLFFRCRELRGLARNSFADLIAALSEREHVRQHSAAFRSAVDAALAEGRILLLVDGLDEIADSGDRAAFVCTLRSALQAYPGTAFVVTSREAGFRHVAAHLAPVCTHATLSSFNADDIRRLSVAWHREVVGDTEKVRADAEQLAADIVANDRIERLAVNPLLLTTLLLVKRWVGSLPTRRAILYGKAVEVLLMTWNTEGHDAIPQEEALPQLCFVAATMMMEKIERISRPRIAELIRQAREALPTELGYVQGSVEDFIHRVEDRSSLLMMTGHDVEDGLLVEFFEFRHLTFQEFLAARAMVEGWHPGREDSHTLADVLETHFDDEKWREVIPLAAVLGGKATEALIVRLTAEVSKLDADKDHENHTVLALANCLADEAAARPATIRNALHELVRFGGDLFNMSCSSSLAKGRYGPDLRKEARLTLLSATSDIGHPADALLTAIYHQTLPVPNAEGYQRTARQCLEMLEAQEMIVRCEGALCLGKLAYDLRDHKTGAEFSSESLAQTGALLEKMLFETSSVEVSAAAYALSGICASRAWASEKPLALIAQLASLWRLHPDNTVRDLALRALTAHTVVPQDGLHLEELLSDSEFDSLWAGYGQLNHRNEQTAALLIAYYRRTTDHTEIISRAQQLLQIDHFISSIAERTLRELLKHLGAPFEAENMTADDAGQGENEAT